VGQEEPRGRLEETAGAVADAVADAAVVAVSTSLVGAVAIRAAAAVEDVRELEAAEEVAPAVTHVEVAFESLEDFAVVAI
jgi:hypothetical protein